MYIVPAFVGLGAPYWDPEAHGTLTGLTHGTGRAHLVRAVLEAACYQTRDVVEATQADAGTPLSELRVDGGMARNDFFLQLQADLLGITVARTAITETTALGAAYRAGPATGLFESTEAIGVWAGAPRGVLRPRSLRTGAMRSTRNGNKRSLERGLER